MLYELHVRDFSVHDETVPDNFRGTFMAFTVPDSNGMQHLKALADAGLTHVHLLPVFDIATINEDKSDVAVAGLGHAGRVPAGFRRAASADHRHPRRRRLQLGLRSLSLHRAGRQLRDQPQRHHPDFRFRRMVAGLDGIGLRVVMDVVYNHTNASGQADKSVLDKIVPGYYHRLNGVGGVETSTCCQNTATEHNMMQKLMVDSVVTWAKAYKVDGFRFDLMGHHMKDNMLAVRAALRRADPRKRRRRRQVDLRLRRRLGLRRSRQRCARR